MGVIIVIRVENNGKFYKITEDEYNPSVYDKLDTILSIIGGVFIDAIITKCEDGEVIEWTRYTHLKRFIHDLNQITEEKCDEYTYKFEVLIGVND